MDLLHDAVSCVFIALDDDGHVWSFCEQRFDFAEHSLNADAFPAVVDFIVSGDGEKDGIFLKRSGTSADIGLIDRDSGFFHENGGDNEENEENENAVNHRREVDHDRFILFILDGASEHKLVFRKVSGKDERFESHEGCGDFVTFIFDNQANEQAWQGDGEACLCGDECFLHAIRDSLHAC